MLWLWLRCGQRMHHAVLPEAVQRNPGWIDSSAQHHHRFSTRRTHNTYQATGGRAGYRRRLPGIGYGRQYLSSAERRLALCYRRHPRGRRCGPCRRSQSKSDLRELLPQRSPQDSSMQICTDLGADWVKTSTGYGTGGATIPDLQLMLANVGPGVQVKAAGGVRDFATLEQVRALGVTRCGASRTQEMLGAARCTSRPAPNRLRSLEH